MAGFEYKTVTTEEQEWSRSTGSGTRSSNRHTFRNSLKCIKGPANKTGFYPRTRVPLQSSILLSSDYNCSEKLRGLLENEFSDVLDEVDLDVASIFDDKEDRPSDEGPLVPGGLEQQVEVPLELEIPLNDVVISPCSCTDVRLGTRPRKRPRHKVTTDKAKLEILLDSAFDIDDNHHETENNFQEFEIPLNDVVASPGCGARLCRRPLHKVTTNKDILELLLDPDVVQCYDSDRI